MVLTSSGISVNFMYNQIHHRVTIGCMIANLYSFGIIDVFVGGWSTLVFLSLVSIFSAVIIINA